MGRLCIRTFGGLRLERDGQTLPLFPTQKTKALFAYLLTFHQRSHPRVVLAGLFWPDLPEERARRNLSDALWRLRRVVGEEAILADEDSLAFDTVADHWLDLVEFEALVASCRPPVPDGEPQDSQSEIGKLQRAADLYRGEFLEGFYDDWALRERERLHLGYLRILEQLLAWHRECNDPGQALEYGLRLVAADPLRESAHRQVMVLYHRLGQDHAALQQFDMLCRILRDEMDAAPLPETSRLADAIRAGLARDRTPFDHFGQAPLVGRRAERARLLARIDAACAGQGGLLLVEGEPGVGKSRLVQEATASAEWRGVQVLWGHCRSVPYAPLVEALVGGLTPLRATQIARLLEPHLLAALVPLLPALAGLVPLPPLPALAPRAELARLHEALARYLLALGQIAPHVLILEDWQEIDPATLEALPALAARLAGSRMLLIGTARSGRLRDRSEVWEQVRTLDRDSVLERLSLARLDAAETGDLICRLLECAAPLPELAGQVYASTQGNPLFVIEWLKALVESGQVSRGLDGRWTLAGEQPWQPPEAVQRVIAARLESLLPAERALLAGAAVLGDPVGFDLWCELSGVGDQALLAGSDELLRRQFLVETPTGYCFAHDLIRQVTYEGINPVECRRLHYRAGLALGRLAPGLVEALALHFELAGDAGRAMPYYVEAGNRAHRLYASQGALHHYGRAIALAPSPDTSQAAGLVAQARCRRAELHTMGGDFASAQADYEAALALLDRPDADRLCRAEALRGLGWLRGRYQGRLDEGLDLLAQAQTLYRSAAKAGGLVQALVHAGHLLAELCRWGEALARYQEALALARQASDQTGLARVLLGRGVVYLFWLKPAQAVADFEEAAGLHHLLGDRWSEAQSLANLGQARLHLPDVAGAVGAFRRAWAINEEIGAGPAQPFVLVGLAYASLLGGDLAGARQAVEEGLTRQRLLSETATNMAFLLANLARVQAHAGQLPAALATARAAAGITGQDRSPTGVWALRWQADLLRLLGCLDEADRLADEALKQAGEIGFQAEVALAHQSLGQNALVRGDLVAARQHLGVAARAARQSGGWYEVGEAYLALGDYWLAAGRPARTLALARRTERKTRAGGAVLLWLQALVSMGHAWLALGGPERAAEPLAEALARAEANGLPILVWRAAAALAQADPGRAGDCLERAWAAVEQVAAQVADAALRRSFLASPEVRRIAEQRERLRRTEGRRQRVVLSGATGQPVPVVWLADAGQADDELLARAGKVALRRARLLRLLAEAHAQGATPTQAELARVLEVSDRTVRSDLAALRGPGREPAG